MGDGGRIFDEGTDKICRNDKGTDNMGEIGPQISRMGTDGGEVFVGDGGRIFDEGTDKICGNDMGTDHLSSLGFLGLLGWFGLGLTAA